MDPLHSPRLGRRARYDSFTLPPHFPDPNYSPRRHLPFAPFAPHPSARAPPAITRDHYDEPQQAFVLPFGDLSYFPSPHRSNPFGFDPHLLHSPRVSDRPIYLGPPNGKPLLPELWERSRGEGGGEDKSRVFDKGPDWFKPYDKFFKLGDPDTALITRRRLESEQDHFLREDSEWKGQRQLRFWDERESRCHDPFLEELPPEAAPLATELPPFSSPRGFRSAVSVNNRGGEASCAFVHRPPPRSPLSSGRSFSELNVVKSTAATVANSKVIENGTGPQLVQSIRKKKNYVRDVSPDCGFEGRQHLGRKAIKKSYPINVANEVDFWSSYHMVRKTPSIPSMDNEHELEEYCSTGNSGKRKMVSHGNAKYYAHLAKQPKQKPSAFSRIQSGLSVWERLEEKSLILSPPCSPPCSLSSPPRISNETEAKADTLDLSLKSNSSAAKVIGPLSAEPSFIAKDVLVEKPNRVTKKKSMLQIREKEVIPIVSSSLGSFAKQGVQRNSNVSSFKSVSVLPEANKEVSSCMPGNKSISRAYRKVKKLAVAKKSDVKEASKMASQVESCIIETTRMEDGMEAPKYEDGIKSEINNCTHSGYIGTEPIDDNHLQISQKGQMMQVTPTNDVSANIITKDVNQARDIVIEILDDSSADIITKDVNQARDTVIEILDDSSADIITKDVNQARDIVIEILDDSAEEGPLEIGKKLNNRCRSPLFSDVNDSSQLYDYIIPSNILPLDNVAAQDSSVNIDENDAANSRKQIKPDLESFVNSHREIGQEMLRPNNAASSELLGAVEGFVSVGSRTPYTDNSLNCNGAEIKIDREVKHREKMVFSTTTKELEAPGNYVSSQSCLQGLQAPSFSEISNADPKQKLSCEGTVEENDAHGGNEDQEHWGKDDAFVSSMVSSALEHGHELCKTIKNHQLMSEKAQLVPSHELKKQAPPNPKLTDEELSCKKALPQAKVPRFLSNRPNFSGSIKEAARIGQTGRHRTWHRTNTPLHSDENPKLGRTSSKEVPKRVGKIQNSSYFRKGNSLIRKLATEPPPVFLPTVSSSIRKFKFITESSGVRENRSECPDNATPSHPFFERPRTPPLPHLSKLSDSTMNSCKDSPQLMQVDRSPESDTDQGNQRDCQSKGLLSGNLESQDTASCKTVETVNDKRVTYVKHKMNQLVAAPGPEIGNSSKFLTGKFQIPVHHPIGRSKTVPLSSSYLYYRSKRNQLIRNASSSDSHLTEIPAGNTNSVDSLQQGKSLPLKKRLDNVLHKVKKPTGSSLVWTLGGGKLSQQGIAKLGCQRVFPYIFPWKRAVNWKSYMITNSIPISSRSVSLISQKLQCMRKRDTIYKVSTNGFSLRKAGVVSIGGSSLKWSKSIEKRSKKASEEATMAVAEVERKKRERKRSKSTCGNRKNKVGLTCRSTSGIGLKPGERIFRVGSARYKMDSSKRSLLRIPDDHSSSPASQQPDNGSQISFVPRRLVIGNNEYVRIGNGNQLVRDPKKLKRILANEKVRWSLHTARLRLAQKRQYCLFFTRFGKCNKIGGKCPFIHDPTKVAICTKFLKGQCFDINCKLTHKVIPERMPDCSYFLKGLCTNINCPYRHVKVNANAPLCDGFLRGHCADGDECRKKHSYTCPLFEATGKCHQGSLCKLHHPKSPNKSRKRKRTKIQSSSQGRYFYSSIGKAGEPLRVASSQNDLEGGNDIFCSDGRFTEYINLDGDSDNAGINVLMESYPGKLDAGYFDMQSCDMDALIKPVRIMNRDDLSIF